MYHGFHKTITKATLMIMGFFQPIRMILKDHVTMNTSQNSTLNKSHFFKYNKLGNAYFKVLYLKIFVCSLSLINFSQPQTFKQ